MSGTPSTESTKQSTVADTGFVIIALVLLVLTSLPVLLSFFYENTCRLCSRSGPGNPLLLSQSSHLTVSAFTLLIFLLFRFGYAQSISCLLPIVGVKKPPSLIGEVWNRSSKARGAKKRMKNKVFKSALFPFLTKVTIEKNYSS